MSSPFCFKDNRDMQCLKTGFTYRDEGGCDQHTDLFYCPVCKAFATNRVGEMGHEAAPIESLDYLEGQFTTTFIESRLKWYPNLTAEDFITGGLR